MNFRFHRHRHGRQDDRHFMRHEHGRMGGRGGWRRGGFGAHELRAGRKLGSAGLQLIILALLKERPRHGYEIIKALEERTGGFYAPSPGMVYPALTYLEEIGHAAVEAEGAKKLYRITPAGEAEFEKNREEAEALLTRFDDIARKMERVREAVDEDGDAAPEIHAARRTIKSALREKRGSSREEQQRIAAILERAAAEIRNTPEKKYMATRAYRYRVTVEHIASPREGEALQPSLSFEAANHDEILGITRRSTERLGLTPDDGAQLYIGLRLLSEFLLRHRADPLFGGLREVLSPFGQELRQRNAPPPEPKAS